MKTCTLLFLTRNDEILLAMKKRSFGIGKWNGVGGKLNEGETIEQALIRECQEEIGVTPVTFEKVAINMFHEFHDGQPAEMLVHVYFCTGWQGEPEESEEMAPKWFKKTSVPYDDMWADDRYWLPKVLAGKKVTADFTLDTNDQIVKHEIREVKDGPLVLA